MKNSIFLVFFPPAVENHFSTEDAVKPKQKQKAKCFY
jgi:hypothetical protein